MGTDLMLETNGSGVYAIDRDGDIDALTTKIVAAITAIDSVDDRVDVLNKIRLALHQVSPFVGEPVDLVLWKPNVVAPPELALLKLSIESDGYTQPIVTWNTGEEHEVVDGFHRHLIGKEIGLSHLPVVVINEERADRGDRISATIRHNRARGKHQVGAMSEIVQELARRNWSEKKIAKELGMEPDEVLRLKQITGLADLFEDNEFSEAWEASDES
jgi:ParB-like chromosome segregation protein Spo0J